MDTYGHARLLAHVVQCSAVQSFIHSFIIIQHGTIERSIWRIGDRAGCIDGWRSGIPSSLLRETKERKERAGRGRAGGHTKLRCGGVQHESSRIHPSAIVGQVLSGYVVPPDGKT